MKLMQQKNAIPCMIFGIGDSQTDALLDRNAAPGPPSDLPGRRE
jgi:hypothetical protein